MTCLCTDVFELRNCLLLLNWNLYPGNRPYQLFDCEVGSIAQLGSTCAAGTYWTEILLSSTFIRCSVFESSKLCSKRRLFV